MNLNREVAEKVMGYKPIRNIAKQLIVERESYFPGEYKTREWNPLEDLNQCFEVVERLKAHDISLTIDNQLIGKWRIEVTGHRFTRFQIEAKTPNEAILKAALEAVKGKN